MENSSVTNPPIMTLSTVKEQIATYIFPCFNKGNAPFSIFYIDDSPVDIWLAETILKTSGYEGEWITASNGQDGLLSIQDYVSKNNKLPNVIFADLQMPRIGGFELIRKIKEMPYYSEETTTLILVTAGLDEEDLEKIKEIGIKNVLMKPLVREELLKLLNK